jgi:hypothetical protein
MLAFRPVAFVAALTLPPLCACANRVFGVAAGSHMSPTRCVKAGRYL